MNKCFLSPMDTSILIKNIADRIQLDSSISEPYAIYGVPRGGVPVALAVCAHLPDARIVPHPQLATIIVDDLIDSGSTKARYAKEYPDIPFFVLIDKKRATTPAMRTDWVVFPWEATAEAEYSASDIPGRLLQFVGEDVSRGGLKETPKRFLKAWEYFTSGYAKDPKDVLKVFEDGAENYDEMVLVKNIPIYSQCEHHLVPFFGVAHIAYIPSGKIVGLSKLSRVADLFARRLQVQERLTNQIADALEENLDPKGVAVVLECRHLCMESRGISQQGHTTLTSAMRGVFMDTAATRAEFMGFIRA